MEGNTGTHASAITRNLPLRMFFLCFLIVPVIYHSEFSDHIGSHLTGGALPNIVRQEWYLVLTNIIIFLTFLIPLRFRRTVDWKEYGLVSAFFVSLFIEMYGIPLSVLFISRYYHGPEQELPDALIRMRVLGVDLSMTHAMVYGLVLMVLGTIFILIGWITLYWNLREHEIVTTGIYSVSRHPQYFGFILVVLGWLIGWPTILVIVFAPILLFMYIRVCLVEERELAIHAEYAEYRKTVPFFI